MTIFSLGSGNGGVYAVRYGCCGCCCCFLQLAYVYCIISINAVSYACNTAVFIYVYFTVNGSSITEQFYGCALAVSQFGCKTVHSQACTAVADGFNTGQILVQVYFVINMTVFSGGSSNGGIYAISYSCCGCCCCFLQLAYVYCISSINAISYACNATVFVYVYFTVDGSSIAEQFYGCTLAVSQFCYHATHCTQGQCCTTIADGFDIFQVFIQLNAYSSAVIAYADVLITAEINIVTGFYIGCFGCYTICGKIPAFISVSGSFFYFLQLAYVYSIIIINACCYAADFAVLIEGNLAVDYGVTILHVNRCAFTINNACSACCTIQCQLSIAVGNRVAGYVNICQLAAIISVYTVFGCNSAGSFDSTIGTADAYILTGNITHHDIIVQVNFINLLAINSSFFNISVVAIYNLAVLACFSCYCIQLAAVYCVSGICRNLTCCYAADSAVFIYGNLAVDYGSATLHVNRCALTIDDACSTCCTIQCQLSIAIADGLNVLQIFI